MHVRREAGHQGFGGTGSGIIRLNLPRFSETHLAENVISLSNISKSYRTGIKRKRKTAVEDLSLEVRAGDIFGLLGPNGAGKTTTIKVLLGIVFPDGGSGALLGQPLGVRRAHDRLGFLPEQPYFYGFMTAEKGLEFYGRFFGLDRKALKHRSGELLDLVGLSDDTHLTLDKYSKGMLQRFGIAQALLNDPDLVMMDEPSSGLDPVGQKEVRDILIRLKEQGKTIFLSSHQLSEVENICDSVTIVNRGRSVKEGRLSELLSARGLTRITLTGGDAGAVERLSGLATEIARSGGETVLDVEESRAFQALEVARDLGMELVSAEPYRQSLEELFLETIRETSA
jgi:ABC-2 type transport system ATP-binding protein